ncbi:hypothetical protein Rhopal_003242-T1 [Rhodotorula paludigena]|uniref:Uncharacterized protein n=1 Tax=Rhodotorula paludigena TaxID=86838 RepID=A0AAV5GJ27_9BASI|nr:hypothetical protein Rhopal_003242-T1 [Rhodotorula paludigena]
MNTDSANRDPLLDGSSQRDEGAIQHSDDRSTGGATSGFDSTAARYSSDQSGFRGSNSGDDRAWETDSRPSNRAGLEREGEEATPAPTPAPDAYSSSKRDSAAPPAPGKTLEGNDVLFESTLAEAPLNELKESVNNPSLVAQPEKGSGRGAEERFDSSFGGGERGVDMVASGGSAYGDGQTDFGGAGRNNDGAGRSSYQPDDTGVQKDGEPGGERQVYP